MKELPKIGSSYNHYDDGKISKGRLQKSVITDIKPYSDDLLTEYELYDKNDCDFLYAKESDYIIEADLHISSKKIEKIKYVRTKYGEWFSLGWWAGLLDVTNKETEDLKEFYENEGVLIKDYYENKRK